MLSFTKIDTGVGSVHVVESGTALFKCFDEFKKPEQLSKLNSWKCTNCKQEVQAIKQIELAKTPPYLVISLNRFKKQN